MVHGARRRRGPRGRSREFDAEIVFEACRQFGVAVEINSPAGAAGPAAAAAAAGGRDRLPVLRRHRRARARAAGLAALRLRARRGRAASRPDRVVNTWPLDDLLAMADRHRLTRLREWRTDRDVVEVRMTRQADPTVDVRRSGDRFATEIGWLDSKHSFSFGQHYDPDNTHFGLLLVVQRRRRAAGHRLRDAPAPRHGDRDLGARRALVHQDSQGHNGLIYPGLAQRMSAGTGILHSEKNDSWRLTGEPRAPRPGALRADVGAAGRGAASGPATSSSRSPTPDLRGGLVRVASGMDRGPRTRPRSASSQRDAALQAARLDPGDVGPAAGRAVRAPVRRRGAVELEGAGRLGTGDAARVTGGRRPAGHRRSTARRGPRLGDARPAGLTL